MVELKWNLQFHFNSGQFHFAIPIPIPIPWLAIPIPIPIPELTPALLAHANSTWGLVPGHWSCNLMSIISMTAWFRSHRPFWNRLSAAVVHTLMFRMLATSLISSELNSPPLSVNSVFITPEPAPTQQVITLSITSDGRFLDRHRHTETRKHVNHVQNPLIAPLLQVHTYLFIESRCHRQCNNLSTWCFLVHFTQLTLCINIIQIIQEFIFPSSSIFHQSNQFLLRWMSELPVKLTLSLVSFLMTHLLQPHSTYALNRDLSHFVYGYSIMPWAGMIQW